jgi:hypothetical protein
MGGTRTVRLGGDELDQLELIRPAVEQRFGATVSDLQLRTLMCKLGLQALIAEYRAEIEALGTGVEP